MQAVHITELKNPTRDFPRAVWISTAIIVVLSILGTLAISVAVPQSAMNLTQSLLVAFNDLWAAFHLPWMGNVMAAMLALGVLGQVSVIVAGPSTGLLAVGKAGYLPKLFQRTNKNGMNVPILILQAVLVSILALALAILPSVQAANQILSQMATIIILAMYVIIYVAAIRLRYTQPNKPRPFKIPGPNNIGLWLVGAIGLIGAGGALVLSFIPPNQIPTGSPVTYIVILSIGTVIFLAIPFVIYACHKKEWKSDDTTFAPFDWQIEGRKPTEVSKWAAGFVPASAPTETSTTPVITP
jgi:amino acid transporter